MSKVVKEMVVSELRDRFGDSQEMLVIDSSRLDAISDNEFRLALREKEIYVCTVKNSLARKALNDSGVTALDEVLAGPSTIVWGGEDIVALSKEIAKWVRQLGDKVEIKGGTVEGTTLSAGDVVSLSKSPGRLELIGQIAGLALSPGAQLVSALLGPGGKLSGQVQAVSEKED